MSEVEQNQEEKKAKFFEGVEQPKKQKNKSKREVVMTWGKYKSKSVRDILVFDEKYAEWIYRQEFVRKFEDIYKVLDDHFKSQA